MHLNCFLLNMNNSSFWLHSLLNLIIFKTLLYFFFLIINYLYSFILFFYVQVLFSIFFSLLPFFILTRNCWNSDKFPNAYFFLFLHYVYVKESSIWFSVSHQESKLIFQVILLDFLIMRLSHFLFHILSSTNHLNLSLFLFGSVWYEQSAPFDSFWTD